MLEPLIAIAARRRCRSLARVLGLVMTAALVAAGLVGVTAPANAAPRGTAVSCGVTITRSVVLHRDLTGCPSNGIVIGADNITLDLNGHKISGDMALVDCERGTACDRGVDNSQGHSGVTIMNGSISGFAIGVWLEDADTNKVRKLRVAENAFVGILVIEARRVELTRNTVVRNGIGNDGGGIGLIASHHSLVERNVANNNGSAGLQAIEGSENNVISRNEVVDNPHSGLSIDGSRNRVALNLLARNGDNMIVAGDRNLVSRNRIRNAAGCEDNGCGFGISFEHGVGNRFTRNLITRAKVGIRVDAFDSPASDTTIDRNLVVGASSDGIVVDLEQVGPVTGTRIYRNVVIGSGDDGIDVNSAATKLTGNTTLRNADLGIEAVTGVTDGGHNRAAGNGNPAQCTGVVCTP
jgi:parallel beta-helix repeat protein